MIRKINHNKWKKNFLIVIFSLMLIFLLFYFKNWWIQNSKLESNILSIRNEQVENKQSEIVYEVVTWKINIYSNTVIDNISWWIEIKFYYDNEKIIILNKNISSDYNFNIAKDTWTLTLSMNMTWKMINNQKILWLDMSWSKEDIVLWEVTIQDLNWKNKSLSIWLK